jgi:hypothetical protein
MRCELRAIIARDIPNYSQCGTFHSDDFSVAQLASKHRRGVRVISPRFIERRMVSMIPVVARSDQDINTFVC